jgi:uncharacterized protein YbjQ (UPF0145 family)
MARDLGTSLPEPARRRVAEQARTRLFTSDLSAGEFLLVREAGFDPLGLVVGCSIHRVQVGPLPALAGRGELIQISEAMYRARELAMARMEAEAEALGADGVVGVRLTVDHRVWGRGVLEFSAIGTAVAHRERPGSFRTRDGRPFTSDLSGQDFYILLRSGFRPLGLVMGNCVYYVGPPWIFMPVGSSNTSEVVPYTQAVYDSRELAMERMQKEASKLGASGVVGADVREYAHSWGPRTLEFLALGTAVEALGSVPAGPPPEIVLPLTG